MGQVFIAAVILLVLMNPPFGAAEDQVKKRSDSTAPWPWSCPSNPRPDRSTFGEDQPLARRQQAGDLGLPQGAALYRFTLAEKHHLTTAFSVNYDDAEGEAGKNRALDFMLTYSYLSDPLVLVVNMLVEHAGYDEKDPAFGKNGSAEGFGVSASVYYTTPWAWSLSRSDAIRFFATGTYYHTDSQGDIYRPESASGAAGVSLEW